MPYLDSNQGVMMNNYFPALENGQHLQGMGEMDPAMILN